MLHQLSKIYRDTLKGMLELGSPRPHLSGRYSQVVAIGKSAPRMLEQSREFCSTPRDGFLLTKEGHLNDHQREALRGFQLWEAGHPLPDARGLLATQHLLCYIAEVRTPGRLLLLLSGGASSLLVAPAPPLDLHDLIALNGHLLASGLPIQEINVLRKHLSLVKGGGLGRALRQRFPQVTQLIESDICLESPEHHLDLVGSGPALADPTSQADADRLLCRLEALAPPSLLAKCRKALRETPKELDLQAKLVADHRDLAKLARQLLGPQAGVDPRWATRVSGDVKPLAQSWSELAKTLRSEGFQGVLVATGEPTVQLEQGHSGRGGRCQELALRFAQAISGLPGIALLAGGSDGSDGPTPHAGALVDGRSWARVVSAVGEESARQRLANHDSSGLLESAPNLLLTTGPTGLNLNDLYLLRISQHK